MDKAELDPYVTECLAIYLDVIKNNPDEEYMRNSAITFYEIYLNSLKTRNDSSNWLNIASDKDYLCETEFFSYRISADDYGWSYGEGDWHDYYAADPELVNVTSTLNARRKLASDRLWRSRNIVSVKRDKNGVLMTRSSPLGSWKKYVERAMDIPF